MIAMNRNTFKCWLCSILLILGCHSSILGDDNPKVGFENIGISLLKFDNESLPKIKLEFKNIGKSETKIDIPKILKNYASINLFVDGKRAQLIGNSLESSPFTLKNLKPGKSYFMSVDLDSVYKAPKSWDKLFIRHNSPQKGYSGSLEIKKNRHEILVLKNNPSVFELKKWENVNVVTEMTAPDVQNNDFNLEMTFENKSDRTFSIPFPSRKQMPFFRGIKMNVDGKQLPYKKKKKDDGLSFTNSIKLKPGQSEKRTIDLSQIFQIPDRWKSIDIKVSRFHEALDKADEISIKRIQTDKKQGNKKEEK